MSRYHPLDVRHPDNRDLLRRNFLLDAPASKPRRERASIDAAPAGTSVGSAPVSESQPVASPWGSRARSARASAPAPSGQQKRNRRTGSWFVLIVLALWLMSDTGRSLLAQIPLFDGLMDTIERFLRQL